MNSREKEILEGVIGILKREFNPPRIALFGSRAKADNSQHADFDFAVEVKRPNISVQRNVAEKIEEISGLYKGGFYQIARSDNRRSRCEPEQSEGVAISKQ